jgi:hypothetical protein
MPDATLALIAAAAIFVVGLIAFLLVDTWEDDEENKT